MKTKLTHHAISAKAHALHQIIAHNHLEVVLPQPTIANKHCNHARVLKSIHELGLSAQMPLAAGLVPTKLLALEEAALAPAWGLHHSTVGERPWQSLQYFHHYKCQNFTASKTNGSTKLKDMFEQNKNKTGTLVCHHAQQCQLSRPWET